MIEMREMPTWHIDDLSGGKVINSIRMDILKYGYVTVADLYDVIACYKPTFEFNNAYITNCYGWDKDNISNFKKKLVEGGYTIIFDEPKLLSEYGVRI